MSRPPAALAVTRVVVLGLDLEHVVLLVADEVVQPISSMLSGSSPSTGG
jgi:hypothetical protein